MPFHVVMTDVDNRATCSMVGNKTVKTGTTAHFPGAGTSTFHNQPSSLQTNLGCPWGGLRRALGAPGAGSGGPWVPPGAGSGGHQVSLGRAQAVPWVVFGALGADSGGPWEVWPGAPWVSWEPFRDLGDWPQGRSSCFFLDKTRGILATLGGPTAGTYGELGEPRKTLAPTVPVKGRLETPRSSKGFLRPLGGPRMQASC